VVKRGFKELNKFLDELLYAEPTLRFELTISCESGSSLLEQVPVHWNGSMPYEQVRPSFFHAVHE
jgi:hypothetical protein